MLSGSLALSASNPDALIYLCTNLYGATIPAGMDGLTSQGLDVLRLRAFRALYDVELDPLILVQ
ncbi:hypothetical protein GCM10023063_45720 [Arthrobacter methylotrophus]